MLALLKGLDVTSLLIKGAVVLVVAGSIWGHGYYTAYQYWDDWYDAEKLRQTTINKEAYERGLKEAEKLQKEEQKDEDMLKQNEKEAATDPDRDRPALSRSSVQRLNRL